MANLHLVTGYAGYEHIKATDQAAFNAALIGTGQFVLDKGKVFEAQVQTNNLVRVLDGELMMQGRFVRLDPDTYVDLTIENGEQGKLRNDLIVARYNKDVTTGVESCNLVIIKGESASSNPVDPGHKEGDITNGVDTIHDYPLWRIPIDGLNVGVPVALYGLPFMDSMHTLHSIREDLNQQMAEQEAKYEAAFEEQNAVFQHAVDSFGGYTQDEVLSDEVKGTYGKSASAVPNDVFAELATSVNKVGDIKTTTRTDLGENWLLCNGEAINQTEYPELYRLNKFNMYESLFEELIVEGTVKDAYVDEDLLMVISVDGDDNTILKAHIKLRSADEWTSQVVYTASYSLSRARISLCNNIICVAFSVAASSSNHDVYGIQYNKETGEWSAAARITSDCSTYYAFSPIRYDGKNYFMAYVSKSNGYAYMGYTSSFLGSWYDGFHGNYTGDNIVDVAFVNGQYHIWRFVGSSDYLVRHHQDSFSTGTAYTETVGDDYCDTDGGAVAVDGDIHYCSYVRTYSSSATNQQRIVTELVINKSGESAYDDDPVLARIEGVSDTVLDMTVDNGKIYVMTSEHIYEYDTESGLVKSAELCRRYHMGKIDFVAGKMVGANGTTVYESKPSVPRIALGEAYTYIKAKE